jgi:hypothetical protein
LGLQKEQMTNLFDDNGDFNLIEGGEIEATAM